MSPTAPLQSETRILDIAKEAITIFSTYGLQSCLMGSAASFLYGVDRTPNDVDLVVLTATYTQEELKRLLVAASSDFYLVNPRSWAATYKVLWHQKGRGGGVLGHSSYAHRCKVDILVPGVMNIPSVPTARIERPGLPGLPKLPMMPLVAQLFLKLQAWSDHRASSRPHEVPKQYTDARDVDQLLVIVVQRGSAVKKGTGWMPAEMFEAARERVGRYVVHGSPSSRADWRALGYRV
ncbi:uncharacterized protein BXZ73DRAFT_77032 [Epithele typhae]|uniref:uncharacterized protein n=1 Tax=Epithele typhae TaxID=378194 RepID=UPI00200836B4|nr:uncharacterized protein BXZ73DRAFT_77032 [Epithele typhae]KAH9934560.1 hypothetical protein BXZ73DRAFT_77032 [Epithele typhae]